MPAHRQHSMIGVIVLVFLGLLTAASAHAQLAQTDRQSIARPWLHCQQGDLHTCNRLLNLPLDNETRALIEVDREQIRERIHVQVRALLQICAGKKNIRACDRALRYSLTASQRNEILQVRKVVQRR